MSEASSFDRSLSHSAENEAVMRPREELLRADGLRRSRVLMLCMPAHAFGSDWAQLEAGTCGRANLAFRDPLNKERRFIPLRFDDATSTFTDLQDHRIKLNY